MADFIFCFKEVKLLTPNIIFYLTDRQRSDTLTPGVMPNLWHLAEEGTRFTNSFTFNTDCNSAKTALQTGKYLTQCEFLKKGAGLSEAEKTLCLYFRENGYSAENVSDDLLLDFISKRSKTQEKPFFIFVSHQSEDNNKNNKHYEALPENVGKFENSVIPDDLSFLKGDYKTEYPLYLSAINKIDENIGKMVEALKEKELYDDTVIIYTSAVGCHFGTRSNKLDGTCHEASVHTPLVISGGAFKRGNVDNRLVSLIDLPPTMLSLAGIYIPSTLSGISLLEQDEIKKRENLLIQLTASAEERALRTEKYKYSVRALSKASSKNKSKTYYEAYLYDLENDPYEKMNLANDKNFKEVRKNLSEQLSGEMEKAWELKPKIKPAIINRKKQLEYGGKINETY